MSQARRFRARALLLLLPALAGAAPDLVILVRHAEKGAAPAAKPSLTPAGRRTGPRGGVLSTDAPLRAIFVTAVTAATAADTVERVRAIHGGTVVIADSEYNHRCPSHAALTYGR